MGQCSVVRCKAIPHFSLSKSMMATSQAFLTFCLIAWLSLSNTRMVNACSSSSQHELYRVVRKTDEGGKQLVVATDEDARLYCRTNVPWKKCWWKPPRNGVREVSPKAERAKRLEFFLFMRTNVPKIQRISKPFRIFLGISLDRI